MNWTAFLSAYAEEDYHEQHTGKGLFTNDVGIFWGL